MLHLARFHYMVLLYVKGCDLNRGMPSRIITSQVLLLLGRRLITILLGIISFCTELWFILKPCLHSHHGTCVI